MSLFQDKLGRCVLKTFGWHKQYREMLCFSSIVFFMFDFMAAIDLNIGIGWNYFPL